MFANNKWYVAIYGDTHTIDLKKIRFEAGCFEEAKQMAEIDLLLYHPNLNGSEYLKNVRPAFNLEKPCLNHGK